MAKLKILVVSKDMGASEMSMPLAELAADNGHEVSLVIEGLAAENYDRLNAWRAEKDEAFLPVLFRGTVDFRDFPFTLDAETLVKKVNPDIVIVTMSSPINLEDQIGKAANTFGIPVVALNDFWGGLTRAKTAKADLMLGIDETDLAAAHRHFSHNYISAVVGNHAVSKARRIKPSPEILYKMLDLKHRFETIILFAGGGPEYTGAEIKLLVGCLQKTPGSWVVIKRYHGKHANRTAPNVNTTWREVWDSQFAPLGDRIIELPTPEGDAVATLSDCTVSGFSTMMTTAVASYKRAIALVTPETRKSLKAQTTLGRYPLAMTGLVPEIVVPTNLAPFLLEMPDKKTVDYWLKPYDPALALREIEKLFG
ncbi:MAG: hypothetical protein HYW90_00195 [Candidatus Sungbacteria bacterium]|nr:hypothetical protein [Candidatus Sungbacteria bacterium]